MIGLVTVVRAPDGQCAVREAEQDQGQGHPRRQQLPHDRYSSSLRPATVAGLRCLACNEAATTDVL